MIEAVGNLTIEQERESWVLANSMLDHHLGKHSFLVSRFLVKPFFKFNTMSVLNTASASLSYNYVTPTAAAAMATGFLKDFIDAGNLSKEFLSV